VLQPSHSHSNHYLYFVADQLSLVSNVILCLIRRLFMTLIKTALKVVITGKWTLMEEIRFLLLLQYTL
jgi:hypothetical protein